MERTFQGHNYNLSLFVYNEPIENGINWNWLLSEFDAPIINVPKQSWAILIIESETQQYALTFGNAFYYVDKFCDRDFAFALARKFKYKKVKTTAQSSPNTNKTKTITSYIDNNYFEYESGESFVKIKANVILEPDFQLFKSGIEIGTSIKFATEHISLSNCIRIIDHIESEFRHDDITKIPVFFRVRDPELLEVLNQKLLEAISSENLKLNFSDFDIVGTTEVFRADSTSYTVKFGRYRKPIPELTQQEIKQFCLERRIDYATNVLNLVIEFENPSHQMAFNSIKELIDFTDDEHSCVLMKGDWYKYNNDYLQALENSLMDLTTLYDPSWNWSAERYDNLINSKYIPSDFPGKTESEAKKYLREKKYYKEYAFNTIMSEDHSFILEDRDFFRTDNGEKVEIGDLYKDNAIFAVKIGNTSSKLCYAIDQLSSSIKFIKKKYITYDRNITDVVVWIVLERQTVLPVNNGKVDLSSLKMIVFKNKLDTWQKEMRQYNFNPILRVCYKH
jgi:uncharacterized protein (TIGR04141 family)